MTVFCDSSALYALLATNDLHHAAARAAWKQLDEQGDDLVTTSFVLAEICSILQKRLGVIALDAFREKLWPFLEIIWVDEPLYLSGFDAVLAANRRDLSLVDCISFAAMRNAGIRRVFAFDPHFAEQGFDVLA